METNANENSFLETFVPETRQPRSLSMLSAGQYLVTIERRVFETDHIDDGEVNAQRDWMDKNEVLYLYLTHPDGVHHLRLYVNGYWKYSDIVRDPAHRSEMQFYRRSVNKAREYAIDTRTNKRVMSERNTKFARQLISEFCTAAGNGEACLLSELEGKKLWIELIPENVAGTMKMKVLQVAAEKDGFKTKPRSYSVNLGLDNVIKPEMIDGETIPGTF